ncbi:MAG: hypothetical protein ACE5JM_13340, partial [Armatimonadota bacterium]
IGAWLDQYYCVLIDWETKTGQRLRPQVVVPTVERLQRFAQQVEGRRLSHVSLWREPSKDVRIVTDALARHAVAQIRADLTAIKDEYPELTELRERPYKIGPTTLGYGSRPKSADRGPTFAVFVGGPFMGDAQPPPGSPWRTLLPRQNIEIDGWVGVSDKRLAELLKQTVERNVEPLLCFERLLGGEPVRGVPRSGSAQQDLGETRAHR